MNGSEDLLTKRELLLAMDRESIRTPNIPVLKFIKEAEYLSAEAQKDKEALEAWYKVLEIYPANQNAQKAVIELEEKLSGSRI